MPKFTPQGALDSLEQSQANGEAPDLHAIVAIRATHNRLVDMLQQCQACLTELMPDTDPPMCLQSVRVLLAYVER